jgi:hypothetical protein
MFESDHGLDFALEHDLFREPASTFRDHAQSAFNHYLFVLLNSPAKRFAASTLASDEALRLTALAPRGCRRGLRRPDIADNVSREISIA